MTQDNINLKLKELGKRWAFTSTILASDSGNGTHKLMKVLTRFTGQGRSTVQFIVISDLIEIPFSKFDDAAKKYNSL